VPSRFVSEIPAELCDREPEQVPDAWDSGGAAPAPRASGVSFDLGDDVVHATLGEGVVTALERGGVAVVRFAGDGSERKLMVDYAPLKKRVP
jgi:DNA helicase II / ATP-dependent DNA helicase PcrA